MIVVVGHPLVAVEDGVRRPAGTAAMAAIAAARAGATVQVVGKVGDDDAGDDLLVTLARAGVGHAALQRDPSRSTPRLVLSREDDGAATIEPSDPALRPTLDPGDVDLALRYLADYRAVVVAEPLPADVVAVVLDAARWAGAALVLVIHPRDRVLREDLPESTLVVEASGDPGDDGLATLIGEVGAEVDAGATAPEAFDRVTRRLGAARPG